MESITAGFYKEKGLLTSTTEPELTPVKVIVNQLQLVPLVKDVSGQSRPLFPVFLHRCPGIYVVAWAGVPTLFSLSGLVSGSKDGERS